MVSRQSEEVSARFEIFQRNSDAKILCSLKTRFTHASMSLRTNRLHEGSQAGYSFVTHVDPRREGDRRALRTHARSTRPTETQPQSEGLPYNVAPCGLTSEAMSIAGGCVAGFTGRWGVGGGERGGGVFGGLLTTLIHGESTVSVRGWEVAIF